MNDIVAWLMSGDPSIVYVTKKDLLNEVTTDDLNIGKIGWCATYLKNRNPDGSWARGFYQPKWTSSHYTLLELKNLGYSKKDVSITQEIIRIIRLKSARDGGINPAKKDCESDVCVTGMLLNYASYFGVDESQLRNIIDFILSQKMPDGGYNCNLNHGGAKHGSMHSTISVLEGLQSFKAEGNTYRKNEIESAQKEGNEFLLKHRLFRSCKTNQIIDPKFLRMTYPFRWKYTILRSLLYFIDSAIEYDSRMEESLEYIEKKRSSLGHWTIQSKFPGNEYFEMETVGKPSKIITLYCLKILKNYRGLNLLG